MSCAKPFASNAPAPANVGCPDLTLYVRSDGFSETHAVAVLARFAFRLAMPWNATSYRGDAVDAVAFKRRERTKHAARVAFGHVRDVDTVAAQVTRERMREVLLDTEWEARG